MIFQGHAVIGSCAGHGRQELTGRRRYHPDPGVNEKLFFVVTDESIK